MAEFAPTEVHIRLGPTGTLPTYATTGSAGCDLYASADLVLRPGETRVLPLDMVMALEPGVEAQVRPRSGLSLKTTLRVPNSPGTIDSDYRSEVGVIVENTASLAQLAESIILRPALALELAAGINRVSLADYLAGNGQEQAAQALADKLPDIAAQTIYLDDRGNPLGTIYIRAGERIAQMVFSRCLQADFQPHEQPENIGRNRGGGFGSTGFA